MMVFILWMGDCTSARQLSAGIPSPSHYSYDIILAAASQHSMAFCGLHFTPLEQLVYRGGLCSDDCDALWCYRFQRYFLRSCLYILLGVMLSTCKNKAMCHCSWELDEVLDIKYLPKPDCIPNMSQTTLCQW
jgi:hypothetical protein